MSFKQIAQYTGSSSTGQFNVIQFSSIPSTYKHLWITGSIQDGNSYGSQTATTMSWYYNTDTTAANYNHHYNSARWSTGSFDQNVVSSTLHYAIEPALATVSDTVYGYFELLIPNYTLSFGKSSLWKNGSVNSGASDSENRLYVNTGTWSGTSAINQITFSSDTSPDFASYTNIAIYGLEG